MEFCQISSFTLCTLKHDAGPQEWLKERSMANRKRAKDYLLSHQPHISSLPTWSHSSQPPWHVWVPLYRVETEAPKRLNTWSQFTKLELSPRLEPKTLSYNMLVPKDGKMVKKKKKKKHCQGLPWYPEIKTPPSHCSGCRFNPWSGN